MEMMEIIDAKTARLLGLKYYFTGKPCKHGHISKRIVHNRACFECEQKYLKDYWKRKYLENQDKEKEYRRNHYIMNSESYKSNARKQRENGYGKVWYKKNKGRWNALMAARRANIAQRTPTWSDLKAINEIYKCCPEGYSVDHIIPLRGKLVSGLHVPGNLQYLTKSENSKKNNIFNPMDFEESVCSRI